MSKPCRPESSAITPLSQQSDAELLARLREVEQRLRQVRAVQARLTAEIAARGNFGYSSTASALVGILNIGRREAWALVARAAAYRDPRVTVRTRRIPASCSAGRGVWPLGMAENALRCRDLMRP